MKNGSEEKDLYALVFSELKNFGVKVPKVKKFKSNIAKQQHSIVESKNKVFGISLSEQEWVSDCGVPLPKFIAETTAYLKNYVDVEIGLFRKAGSVARQRELRARLEKRIVFEKCEPNDVASLLKQWLRELPEPVIPIYLHDLFVKCHSIDHEEDRVTAVLMCCLLLPSEHLYTLKHLLKFLSLIASKSDVNKMVPHNLAVVMAPNLLSCGCDKADKSSNSRVQSYTALIELLIVNADHVGQVPPQLAPLVCPKTSDNQEFPVEALDISPSRLRKKSGGVTDLVNGIRKFVGNNLTPMNNCMDTVENPAPRSAHKRKADPDLHSSSNCKNKPVNESRFEQCPFLTPAGKSRFVHLMATPGTCPNLNTPLSHIRRKSFGLLSKRRQKRMKSSKPSSITKENSPMLGVTKLSDNSTANNVKKDLQKNPFPEKCFLAVPTVDPSPVIYSAGNKSQAHKENHRIVRVNSDQPLSLKKEKLPRTRSTSHVYQSSNKSDAGRANSRSRNCRSPMLEPVNFKGKAPNKRANLSPALLKRSEVLTSLSTDERIRKTESSSRGSGKKKVRPNDSTKRSPGAAAADNAVLPDATGAAYVEPNSDVGVPGLNVKVDEKVEEIDSSMRTPEMKPSEKRNSMRRGGNKSSLRRGRPNTIKTGLPLDLCPKYSTDSTSLKFDLTDDLVSPDVKQDSKVGSDEPLEGISVILKDGVLQPKRRSVRKQKSCAELSRSLVENSASVKNQSSSSLQDFVGNKEEQLIVNSLMFVPEAITENELLESWSVARSRRSSTSANVLSPAKVGDANSPAIDFKLDVTETSFKTSVDGEDVCEGKQWNDDAENFLSSHLSQAVVPSCKRESIVQIAIKNAGNVKANVHFFDLLDKTTPSKISIPDEKNASAQKNAPSVLTPLKREHSTPRGSRHKTPVPPPPKFLSPEKVYSPLKDVTNLSNGKDLLKTLSSSPVDKINASPPLPKRKSRNPKRNAENELRKLEGRGAN